jgi:uncharacterized protein YutE (UPF0331/DUF86 family)
VTDPALIRKRLALIETCVAELRSLARPELIRSDVREERFVEHTLQIAIQAALDVASHVHQHVADETPQLADDIGSYGRSRGGELRAAGLP